MGTINFSNSPEPLMSAQTDFCMEIGIFHENVRNTFVNKCKMIDNQYAVLCQSQIPVLKVLGLNPSGITGKEGAVSSGCTLLCFTA